MVAGLVKTNACFGVDEVVVFVDIELLVFESAVRLLVEPVVDTCLLYTSFGFGLCAISFSSFHENGLDRNGQGLCFFYLV